MVEDIKIFKEEMWRGLVFYTSYGKGAIKNRRQINMFLFDTLRVMFDDINDEITVQFEPRV